MKISESTTYRLQMNLHEVLALDILLRIVVSQKGIPTLTPPAETPQNGIVSFADSMREKLATVIPEGFRNRRK